MWLRALALSSLGLAACGPMYAYQPTEEVYGSTAGRPASRYAIPEEAPSGEVRATTLGVNRVRLAAGEPRVPYLQMRMIVENDTGTTNWVVDTRQQLLDLPGAGQLRPTLAIADRGQAPLIFVAPGEARAIDLYYTLPEGMEKAGEIPEFNLSWSVQTERRLVRETTPFERIELTAPPYFFPWNPGG